MKFILGKKLEMSQIFAALGMVIPVTVVGAGPCQVTQIRTREKDGYRAVQIGFGERKRLNKPVAGHLKGLSNFRYLSEFRMNASNRLRLSSNSSTEPATGISKKKSTETKGLKRGDVITVRVFEVGDKVKVTGVSKGKGFQGVVKRHGFHGSPASHGHKDQLRMPGSIGATDAARVFKGMRMPGRMGGEQVTVSNLEIVKVEPEKNLLFIKGAVPGRRNGLVEIRGEGEMVLETQESTKTQKHEGPQKF